MRAVLSVPPDGRRHGLSRAVRLYLSSSDQPAVGGSALSGILKKRLLPLPVVSAVSDYLENCCLIAVVSACPEALQIAAAAPFFTVVKSAAGMLTFVMLAVLLLWQLAGRMRKS